QKALPVGFKGGYRIIGSEIVDFEIPAHERILDKNPGILLICVASGNHGLWNPVSIGKLLHSIEMSIFNNRNNIYLLGFRRDICNYYIPDLDLFIDRNKYGALCSYTIEHRDNP